MGIQDWRRNKFVLRGQTHFGYMYGICATVLREGSMSTVIGICSNSNGTHHRSVHGVSSIQYGRNEHAPDFGANGQVLTILQKFESRIVCDYQVCFLATFNE